MATALNENVCTSSTFTPVRCKRTDASWDIFITWKIKQQVKSYKSPSRWFRLTWIRFYSKASSYTALSYTGLADAWFLIRSKKIWDTCSENLKLHDFLMILPLSLGNWPVHRKKNLGPIMSNFWGCFFHVFEGKNKC